VEYKELGPHGINLIHREEVVTFIRYQKPIILIRSGWIFKIIGT
jgi:hypothetical protein